MVWSGEFAFANGSSLAAVGRLFGYTGGLITTAQRTAMGQADVVLCDLFVRLTQGGATSIAEEDAIEMTEGWRNSQWPDSMVTMPVTRAAASVDLKRMFDYAAENSWKNFKTKAVAAAKSRLELRALFPNESNPAIVEATLLQLAPEAKAAVTLPPHSILEAVGRLALLHLGWLQRSDVCTWSTDAIAAALLERLRGAGLATQNGNSLHTAQDGNKGGWPSSAGTVGGRGGIAPSMQQKWMVCAASQEHNVQLPVLEAYLLRVDHDPVCALEMAFTGQYPIELLAESTPTSAAGKAMIAHNVGRTPLCILHQICWGVVRAVVVLPTLSLLEQYAVTHRSKLWGRVVARCYALRRASGRCARRRSLHNTIALDLTVLDSDQIRTDSTAFGNAIFRTLRMDTRGKEWSSALNMPNSFAALHANITADGTRGVEKANQEFAVGILAIWCLLRFGS